jgi:carbon-monoxide dehydrogenase small subunit
VTEISISLTINGKAHNLSVAPNIVLADLLRERFALNGCKVGCDEGVCGACTVLVDGKPAAACATFAFAVDRRSITTIEGLGRAGELNRVQAAFLATGAFQCGFCTSGMILSVVGLLARVSNPDDETIRIWLSGNLCRCTGYRQIVDAIRHAMRAEAEPVP